MTMLDELVILPNESMVICGTAFAAPYVAGFTAVVGSRLEFSVPLVMLLAFVVSAVAEGASPDMLPELIVTGTFDARVILPYASTVICGILAAVPYDAGVTDVVGRRLLPNVPLVMLPAFVVSIDADAVSVGVPVKSE